MIASYRPALFSSLALLALAGIVSTVGCTVTTSSSEDAGPPTTGDAGASCAEDGVGTIELVVTGLPDDVGAKVKLTGPAGATDATGSTTSADRPAGSYTVTAERVSKADPIVRTLYEPKIDTSSFCLAGEQKQTVTVAYDAIASSNKLWTANVNNASGQVLGFGAENLVATGTFGASVAMKGAVGAGAGKALAFDKDGNLWALGPTTTDAPLSRFPAASLGTSGQKEPDRKLVPALGGCLPGPTALAFDPAGALWMTVACSDRVLRISPETLSASNKYTPEDGDFATGVESPRAVAFDKDGNMWVSGKDDLHRYPAASLAADQAHVSDFALRAKSQNGGSVLAPDALAFDKDGNLWVTNFGANVIFKLTPSDLAVAGATKEIEPTIQISIPVGALVTSIAFDESGGLWLTYSQGKFARLDPAQLETSSDSGSPTVPNTIVTSDDVGSAGSLAFFPAPAGLPLYSRFE
ncbi:MAG TPA: hypothetical protein VM580_28320 [Labilithrix sp.]|nr:hypothetical protein [Labilithrix sp.]